MSFNRHLFSSQRGDWRTPKALYQALDAEFGFDFDAAPSNPTFDGLSVEWGGHTFLNPPYGRQVGKWVQKAYEESLKDKLVVMLLPSRTDTRWFQAILHEAKEVLFIAGRLKFDDQASPAPFPSVLVLYSQDIYSLQAFAGWGYLMQLARSRLPVHPTSVLHPLEAYNNDAFSKGDQVKQVACPSSLEEVLKTPMQYPLLLL